MTEREVAREIEERERKVKEISHHIGCPRAPREGCGDTFHLRMYFTKLYQVIRSLTMAKTSNFIYILRHFFIYNFPLF